MKHYEQPAHMMNSHNLSRANQFKRSSRSFEENSNLKLQTKGRRMKCDGEPVIFVSHTLAPLKYKIISQIFSPKTKIEEEIGVTEKNGGM